MNHKQRDNQRKLGLGSFDGDVELMRQCNISLRNKDAEIANKGLAKTIKEYNQTRIKHLLRDKLL